MNLKSVGEQTILITGATSGIGLTTARKAAEKGANLMLVSRNEQALRKLVNEINTEGKEQAVFFAADVADEKALRTAAEKAVQNFGSLDTWVNNAGGSIYGKIADVPNEDFRRMFDTNFWGVVNGSRLAVEFLSEKGGALINVGSEVSEAPIPLQGMYSASKHAVKGFTDALRIEIEADKLPIAVTLIKPTAIHTPFVQNARNYLPYEPQLPPPVYAPDLVADAILYCAENPTRDMFVGGMAKAHVMLAENAPSLYGKAMEMTMDSMQNSGKPPKTNRKDGLFDTNSKLNERGEEERFVMEKSLYQQTQFYPWLAKTLALGGTAAIVALLASKSRKNRDDSDNRKLKHQENKPKRPIGKKNKGTGKIENYTGGI